MLSEMTQEQIRAWRFNVVKQLPAPPNNVPRAHALRLLREVTELCLACGAVEDDIQYSVNSEITKAICRNEHGRPFDFKKATEEVGDAAILLQTFCDITGIDPNAAALAKVPVLNVREWEVDGSGVFWRKEAQ